jgi:hypothetical protein
MAREELYLGKKIGFEFSKPAGSSFWFVIVPVCKQANVDGPINKAENIFGSLSKRCF